MKNDFINKFDNTIKIKIKGKNIERFLKRLISLEIDLLEIEYIKYNEINIKVYKKELKKIEEIKTIYDITIIDIYGIDRIKNIITKNKYIIISIIISFLFILYLSNTIFSISVIHNDSKLRDLIIEELRDNNIRVYGFKQNYKYINKVKENILKKHKDKIEWLEIENIGTKYIVRVEERKINNLKDIDKPRNLIAKKNGLIKKIIANKGEIVKLKNEYVKKGETIISGNIYLNETIKDNIVADGIVYGEVWYNITIEYPLEYIEQKITSKKKNNYVFKFVNFKLSFNNKDTTTKEEILLKHLFLPISFIKETKNKIINIEQKLTKEEAIDKAISLATNKLQSKLNDNEYIIDTKKLKVEQNNSKIVLDIFYSVYENIGEYQYIEEQ